MSETPAQIEREAKSLHQGLKELLKSREVVEKEIEIQRKNLRRQYLRLLFVYPYAKESKDAETHLWMQTSYALISIYKHRIATLDRAIHHPPRHQPGQAPNSSRTVEYRKLLQRFRQFLAEEEKFWTEFILRLRRNFALDDTQCALTALGIIPQEEPPAASGNGQTRRNQFQFPPESDPAEIPTTTLTPAQRESRMAILSKALVYLGDIARYKEQYNEAGGRPRAGHEDGPPAAIAGGRGRGRRGGGPGSAQHILPRLRNYDRAQACYEQARVLLPHDGNPSHQLAILSSYQQDAFGSIMHYYRALCVRSPYDMASENMGTVLKKALDQYKSKGLLRVETVREEAVHGAPSPRLRVEAFKEKVVILHAQWCMNIDEAENMGDKVIDDFAGLVADRILPIEMISKVVVLAQGALWKHRLVRRSSHGDRRGSSKSAATESRIATHVIAVHRVLLHNGSVELTEFTPEDAAEQDLAQHITATFRRTLPALRMAGKWLRANTRYVSQRRAGNSQSVTISGLSEFWTEYVRFSNTLLDIFPEEKLPQLAMPLEEDIEMNGFLPLRKYMIFGDNKGSSTSRADQREQAGGQDQVHPNEEQLMRIADILIDAKAVTEDENTPTSFEGGQFSLTEAAVQAEVMPTSNGVVSSGGSQDEASAVQSPIQEPIPVPHGILPKLEAQQTMPEEDTVSVTTDDPVGDAFRTALDDPVEDIEEEEEDEIVWQPNASLSPPQLSNVIGLPTTPPKQGRNIGLAPGLTPRREPISPLSIQQSLDTSPPGTRTLASPVTTAEDLLNNVLGRLPGLPPPASHHASALNLSFGLGGPGHSIWSAASADKLPAQYPTSNGHTIYSGSTYNTQVGQSPPAHALPPVQSSWSPAYPMSNIQELSSPFAPSRGPHMAGGGHHRLPSDTPHLPLGRNQPTHLQSPPRYDHLNLPPPIGGYSSPQSSINNNLGGPHVYRHDLAVSPQTSAPTYHRQNHQDQYGMGVPNHELRAQELRVPYRSPPSISQIWGNVG